MDSKKATSRFYILKEGDNLERQKDARYDERRDALRVLRQDAS